MNFNLDNPKNWTEDFDQENGCYINVCVHCESEFMGHKRRACCKECYVPLASKINKEDKEVTAMDNITESMYKKLVDEWFGRNYPNPYNSAMKNLKIDAEEDEFPF